MFGRCRRPSARRARRPSPSATACSARWSWRPPSSKSSTRRRRATPRAPTSRSAASARPVRERFRVGYAPARWDALSSYLAAQKIPPSDLERLGLVGVNERGRYDFFRDRVMLPVIDRQKRVIGFGGRLLDPEAKDRKYVNSPDSPLFHKKEQLYGLHAALDAIRRERHRDRRRGQLRRAVAARGGHRGGGRADGHGADRGADRRAGPPRQDRRRRVRRRHRRPARGAEGDPAVRRRRHRRAHRAPARRASTPTTSCASPKGADAFRRLVEGARPMLDQFIQDVASDANVPGPGHGARDDRRAAGQGEGIRRPASSTPGSSPECWGWSPQQVRRALQEAAAATQRQARPPDAAAARRRAARGARAAAPARCRPRSCELLVVLASYPELLRTPEAARGGRAAGPPAVRQLYRAAAEQVARDRAHRRPGLARHGRGRPMRAHGGDGADGRQPRRASPIRAGYLRKLVTRLELLRVDAEIAMNTRLQREAQARGDEAARAGTRSAGDRAATKQRKGCRQPCRGRKRWKHDFDNEADNDMDDDDGEEIPRTPKPPKNGAAAKPPRRRPPTRRASARSASSSRWARRRAS